MKIKLHRDFEKQYRKLKEREKKKFKQRRDLFLQDEFNPILNNHSLKGKYQGYRSINITGDLRAIYKRSLQGQGPYRRDRQTVIFVAIHIHSNLYG